MSERRTPKRRTRASSQREGEEQKLLEGEEVQIAESLSSSWSEAVIPSLSSGEEPQIPQEIEEETDVLAGDDNSESSDDSSASEEPDSSTDSGIEPVSSRTQGRDMTDSSSVKVGKDLIVLADTPNVVAVDPRPLHKREDRAKMKPHDKDALFKEATRKVLPEYLQQQHLSFDSEDVLSDNVNMRVQFDRLTNQIIQYDMASPLQVVVYDEINPTQPI